MEKTSQMKEEETKAKKEGRWKRLISRLSRDIKSYMIVNKNYLRWSKDRRYSQ
jgi:hypothetical protein